MLTNLTLAERAKYAFDSFTSEELELLMLELEGFRSLASDNGCDDEDELESVIKELESNQANPDHADYDDLNEFFWDCVNSLNRTWHCAEAYDIDLRNAICDAIARGSVEK